MLIPHDLLEADTLNNLLEDFVTREGTDNGDETPLDVRVERARHALRRGEAVIAVAAVLLDREQAAGGKLRQMPGRRLRRDMRGLCECACRQRAPVHQRMQHAGARRIARQTGYFRECALARHGRLRVVGPCILATLRARYFGRDRNVPPRGARMVAVMTRPSILTTLVLWYHRCRTRRHLRDLPPHLLRDVGLDDAAREHECRQWPWQGRADDSPKENGRRLRAPVGEFAVSDKL